jgi:hypothetical protein
MEVLQVSALVFSELMLSHFPYLEVVLTYSSTI